MGKKNSLKSALSSHQSRLQKKQHAAHAAQAAQQKDKITGQSSKRKSTHPAPIATATVPFKPTHKILLIGEGNFSFAHALVFDPPPTLQYLPAASVTATAYDTEEECYTKYSSAKEVVRNLREKGAEIIFGVDATKLEKHAVLKSRKFDRIVWNFPHAGKGITDQDRNILSNQMLLLGFLRSAAHILSAGPAPVIHTQRKRKKTEDDDAPEVSEGEGEDLESAQTRGTVLITLRNVPPYTLWDLPKLAKNPPPTKDVQPSPRYTQLRSFIFHRSLWKGYEHRMTKGERAHGSGKTGVGGEDRMWEFCLRDSSYFSREEDGLERRFK
ncbi:hypothetical protein PHLCEN_2v2832 [Hermanssonia centrifuga]|uniref:25S rRNA (uridine-N(3))-methyltransferase BMT5-like domain-containing protein n=1 Tax=Hermanssonia centrifuga TaxID=98765 RepID=A0A2R6RI42_9APHY|nr:hypothetical protein PHLCEN_2v2832 [Hermanssonia centrifuga]